MSDRPSSYEEYVEAQAALLLYEVLRPWSDRKPGRLFQELIEASQRYGKSRAEIRADIEAQRNLQMRRAKRDPLLVAHRTLYFGRAYSYRLVQQWVDRARYRPWEGGNPAPVPLVTPRRISIVVLSYDRIQYLKTTIASVHATTHRANFELIVVDNGSTDGSAAYLREAADAGLVDKVVLCSRNHGTSIGFNTGFAYSDRSTDFLSKLDSDMKLLSPGWFGRFVSLFESNQQIAILSLNQVNQGMLRVAPSELHGEHEVIAWSRWIAGGSCMTIPRRVFERVGHFNEGFDYAYMPDDADYYDRIIRLGYEAYYLKNDKAYHRTDLDKQFRKRTQAKKIDLAKSLRARAQVLCDYDSGQRELRIWYPKYDAVEFPAGTRVIEIE